MPQLISNATSHAKSHKFSDIRITEINIDQNSINMKQSRVIAPLIILATLFISICDSSMVFIQNGDQTTTVDSFPHTTVNDLVNEFCRATPDMNADEVMLIYQGQELRDRAALLSDLGICSEAVLECKRMVKLKTILMSCGGCRIDKQIEYSIIVGAPGFLAEIERQTRRAMSIDPSDGISFRFQQAGSNDLMKVPEFGALDGEYDSRCVNRSVVEEMRIQRRVQVEILIYHGDAPCASSVHVLIRMPVNLGVVIFGMSEDVI